MLLILSSLVGVTLAQTFLYSPHPNTGFVPNEDMPCDPNENTASGLNYYGCNDAGTCRWLRDEFGNEAVGEASECLCCDQYNENSWCYGGMEDGEDYDGFILSGTQCALNRPQHGMTFGWRFETAKPLIHPIICSDTADPDPANQKDCTGDNIVQCQPNMDLSKQLELALMYPCESNTECAQISSVQPTYDGIMIPIGCQTCSSKYPCDRQGVQVIEGVVLGYASYLNTYYDPGCAQDPGGQPKFCQANKDYGHEARHAFRNSRGADGGLLLGNSFYNVLDGSHPKCGTDDDKNNACAAVASINFSCDPDRACPNKASYFERATESFTTTLLRQATLMPSMLPTRTPFVLTSEPTATPTEPDECWPYINQVLDHKFIGAGTNCRAGIEPWWPDGISCKSPYVVCLPEHHTPKNPDPSKLPNVGQTLPAADYSINECAQECAYDQRCSGFEMELVPGTSRGICYLIDDVEIIIQDPIAWPAIGSTVGTVTVLSDAHIKAGLPEVGAALEGPCCAAGNGLLNMQMGVDEDVCQDACFADVKCNAFSYGLRICMTCEECTIAPLSTFSPTKTYTVTKRLELGGAPQDANAAVCFAKKDYCNPYFEASDLNEVMLKCYCPNNRKGTYTKKVKRTVPNTKFCDSGYPEIEERIQKAQANRMFHLCENWCLFETNNPLTESWYWNPWHKCWREQYAGTGVHRSYCNRVIRNPDTIEQHFINKRAERFCTKHRITAEIIDKITQTPTLQPSTFGSSWFLADEEDNCDETCESQGMECDEGKTNSLVTGMDTQMNEALKQATGDAQTCSAYVTAKDGWAMPGIKNTGASSEECHLRDPATEYTGCNWAIGVGYKRLCACYTP